VTIKVFLGYLEQDVQNQNGERMDQDLTYIRTAADKMSELLDELLELSCIGRMIHPPVEIPLQGLVQEALDLVAGQINERGLFSVFIGEECQAFGIKSSGFGVQGSGGGSVCECVGV